MSRPPDDKETALLEEFRGRLEDLRDERPDMFHSDSFLLRWLRARNHDLNKAEGMLRNHFRWREKHKVDNILFEPIPSDLNELFNCNFSVQDKGGHLVLAMPLGEIDVRPWVKDNHERLYRYLVQTLEIVSSTMIEYWRNFRTSLPGSLPHTEFTVIIDLKGLSYTKMTHRRTLELLFEIVRMYEANFPETLASAILINAPWMFPKLFALIRPMLSPSTQSKINVFDSNEESWRAAVAEIIDEESLKELPYRYGGTDPKNQ